MRVYEVMSKQVETVKPTVRASEARNRMRQKRIHHLVVTRGTEVAGVITDRDLGGGKLPKSLGTWTVEDLMTTPVVTVTTRTPVRRAARLMKGQSVGSLVVTSSNGKLAGIVTVSDLLALLASLGDTQPRHESAHDSKGKRRRTRQKVDETWDE